MRLFTFIINAIDNDTKKRLIEIERKLDLIISENEKLKQEIVNKLEESIAQVKSIV